MQGLKLLRDERFHQINCINVGGIRAYTSTLVPLQDDQIVWSSYPLAIY